MEQSFLSKEKDFVFDAYHSIVLNHYMQNWGMPEHRVISVREESGDKIIVYDFPCNAKNEVSRIATIGVSLQKGVAGNVGCEYVFVLPCDYGGASLEQVFNYILDISAHTISEIEDPTPPRVMPPSNLAPDKWGANAMLFDELRGENEGFHSILFGDVFKTQFIWGIPIFKSEYEMILENGIEFFDALESESEVSIIDVNRNPWC